MGYCICQEARHNKGLIGFIFLVDRTKTKMSWWTEDNSNHLMVFKKKSAAEFQVRKLSRNNPQVITHQEALDLIQQQMDEKVHFMALNDAEAGWDGHKIW